MAEDTSGSAELARGHVSLTVAYKDAQGQVADDLKKVGEQGAQAGTVAGQGLHDGIVGGIQKAADTAKDIGGKIGTDTGAVIHTGIVGGVSKTGDEVASSIVGGISANQSRAEQIGSKFGTAIGYAIAAPIRLASDAIEGLTKTHGDSVDVLQGKYNSLSESIINTKTQIKTMQDEAKRSATANVSGGGGIYDASKILAATATLEGYEKEQGKVAAAIEDVRQKTNGTNKELDAAGKGILNFGVRAEGISSALEKGSGKLSSMNAGVAKLGVQGTETAEEVSGIGEAIAGLITDPVVLVGAAILGVAGTVVELTRKLYELGNQWEETMNSMAIATGASGEELEGLGKDVDAIAPHLALPIAEIGKDVAQVKQNFGDLDDASLTAVTTQVGELQKMVGQFDLRAVGQSFKSFGVTGAKDQIVDLNELFHAYQETGVGVDELARDVANAGPVAAQFNLNWGQTAGILTGFQTAGLDSSKALLALSAAQKSLEKGVAADPKKGILGIDPIKDPADLNKGLTDALTNIQNLQKAGDAIGAKNLAEQIFGKSTGRGGGPADNILQVLQKGFDPSNFEGSVNKATDSISGMYHQTETLSDRWTDFKNASTVALQPLSDKVHEIIDKDLTGLTNWVSAHQQDIVHFFGLAAKGATDFGEGVGIVIGGVIQIFADLEAGVGRVIQVVGEMVRAFGDAVSVIPAMFGGGDDAAKPIFAVADALSNTQKAMQKNSDEATAMGQHIQAASRSAAGSIRDQITGALEESDQKVLHVGDSLAALSHFTPPKVDIDTSAAQQKIKDLGTAFDGITAHISGSVQASIGPAPFTQFTPHRAWGGEINGSGTKGKDSVPIYAAPGEHMWTADEVDAVGGQRQMYHLRAMAKAGLLRGYAGGGALPPAMPPGRQDDQGNYLDANGNPYNYVPPGVEIAPDPGDPTKISGGDEHEWHNAPNYPTGSVMGTGSDKGLAKWLTPDMKQGLYDSNGNLVKVGPNASAFGHNSVQPIFGFAGGGAIGDDGSPDVTVAEALVGTKYSQAARNDCSGMVGQVINGALGTGGGLPTTQTMEGWLSARGFVSGTGGPGMISVGWYNHGSAPNDGHAAMTLSDGENAEAGGSHGSFLVGAGAAGADSAEFDHHMYLPQMFGEGADSSGGVSGALGGNVGTRAPSAAQIQSANDSVTKITGAVNVATQKLQEAKDAPLGKGKNAEEDHNKAVGSAQDRLDSLNRDLDTASKNRDNLLSGDATPQVLNAQNALALALNKQVDAQTKLNQLQDDPKAKPDQITAAQNALTESTNKVTEAQQNLASANEKTSKATDKGGKDNPLTSLGQAGTDFLKGNLPPGFSDPTSWPLVKTAGNLLKDIGGMVKDPTAKALLSAGGSAVGGDASGAAGSLVSLLPKPFGAITIGSPGDSPGVDDAVPAAGSSPGISLDPAAFIPKIPNTGQDPTPGVVNGDTNIDASTTINGKADHDTQSGAAKVSARKARVDIPRQVGATP